MTDTAARTAERHVPADLPDHIQHYIGGEFVDSLDGATFDVLDPVSNETYLTAAAGKKADIDRAVAAAKRAFEEGPWPRMLPRERARIRHPIADIVDRFSQHKLIHLQFAQSKIPDDLAQFGRVLETVPPRVKLEVPRQQIPMILSNLLRRYEIEDVGVQERPLEDVIADVFTQQRNGERRG